jgi:hypothetical protein
LLVLVTTATVPVYASHVHNPTASSSDSNASPKVNLIEKGPTTGATSTSGVDGPSGSKSANDNNPSPKSTPKVSVCNAPVGYDCFGNKLPSTPTPQPTPTPAPAPPAILYPSIGGITLPQCEFYKGRNIGPFPCSYESGQAPQLPHVNYGNGSNSSPGTKHMVIGNITGSGAIIGGIIK